MATAAAVKEVVVAAAAAFRTGTTTATRDMELSTITTTQAIHRMGRAILPQHGTALVSWFLAAHHLSRSPYLSSRSAQIESDDPACFTCNCRSSKRSRTRCISARSPVFTFCLFVYEANSTTAVPAAAATAAVTDTLAAVAMAEATAAAEEAATVVAMVVTVCLLSAKA